MILVEDPIIADNRYVLRLSLRDEHPVERILMCTGQKARALAVLHSNAERSKTKPFHSRNKLRREFLRARQLSNP